MSKKLPEATLIFQQLICQQALNQNRAFKHPFRTLGWYNRRNNLYFSFCDKYRNKVCPVTSGGPAEALGWFAIQISQRKKIKHLNTAVSVCHVYSHLDWTGKPVGVGHWECGIPLLTGSVDFWLSVSQRRGAGQAFQPYGDKEALSTAVILWRRSGSAAGLLHTGLQDPQWGSHTHCMTTTHLRGQQCVDTRVRSISAQSPRNHVGIALLHSDRASDVVQVVKTIESNAFSYYSTFSCIFLRFQPVN